ncbi:hypothetical protein [Phaeobacter sp. JH18-32]|uniref:hypothetical protein n=1 Tax=Phaeobacter sp. JH18-32 TaxID=3112457 RepID=UPI003A883E8D
MKILFDAESNSIVTECRIFLQQVTFLEVEGQLSPSISVLPHNERLPYLQKTTPIVAHVQPGQPGSPVPACIGPEPAPARSSLSFTKPAISTIS